MRIFAAAGGRVGEVVVEGLVDTQLPARLELEDGGGGELLAHRCDVPEGVARRATVALVQHDVAIAGDQHRAGETVLGGFPDRCVQRAAERGPVWRRLGGSQRGQGCARSRPAPAAVPSRWRRARRRARRRRWRRASNRLTSASKRLTCLWPRPVYHTGVADRSVFFATCAPGVEPVLHAEVRALKLAKSECQVGGVRFEGEVADGWRANLWLRTAVRVLQRVARFPALDGDALYDGVAGVEWSRFVTPAGTLVVDAQARASALDHTQFIAQRVKDAVVDQLRARSGQRPSVDKDDPDLRIHLHLYRDRATLSVDTSGASLHKRGWRRYQGPAPLSETLAAAIVLLSGWDRRAPLLDPFCGSGTILVEAASLAAGLAPGRFRRFGFERWPNHDPAGYAVLRDRVAAAGRSANKVIVLGSGCQPRADRGRAHQPRRRGAGRSGRGRGRCCRGLRAAAGVERLGRHQPALRRAPWPRDRAGRALRAAGRHAAQSLHGL